MFEGAQAVWDDAYVLASTNVPADTDEVSVDSEQKAFTGSSKDKSQPQLSGTSNAANNNPVTNAVDDFMNWSLGEYIWEFFDSYHPEELFKVRELLQGKHNQDDDGDDDGDSEEKDDK